MAYYRASLTYHTYEELIHLRDMKTPPRIFVIATGGGSQMQSTLWAPPGASAYMVGGMFPYDTGSTANLLGYLPAKFVSRDVAIGLAQRAYQEACRSQGHGKRVGIGMTCSVSSKEKHRGDHKVIVAGMTDTHCYIAEKILSKGIGDDDRKEDDLIAEAVAFKVLFTLLAGHGVKDRIEHRDCAVDIEDAAALNHDVFFDRPLFQSNGKRLAAPEDGHNMILLPGTFNPLHFGHTGMEDELVRFGEHVVYTTCANPPHKPALSIGEMLSRANQFTGRNILFTENDPLYIDKARQFPGCGIALGADSLERMLDPKWGHDPGVLLAEFKKLKCQLYVFDRTVKGVRNSGLKALDKAGCRHYGAAGYITVMDETWSEISSTQLRSKDNDNG